MKPYANKVTNKVLKLVLKCTIIIVVCMTATLMTANIYKRGIYQFTMYCFLLQFIAEHFDLY